MSVDDTSPCPLCGDTKLRAEALRIQGALDILGIIKRTCAEDRSINLETLLDTTVGKLVVDGSLVSKLLWECQIKHIEPGKGRRRVFGARKKPDWGKDQDSSGSEGDALIDKGRCGRCKGECPEAWIDKCNGKGKGVEFFDSQALRERLNKQTYRVYSRQTYH